MDNSGTAFPQHGISANGDPFFVSAGLTKREWFAGMVAQGLLAGEQCPNGKSGMKWKDCFSEYVYELTDSLLAEGKK